MTDYHIQNVETVLFNSAWEQSLDSWWTQNEPLHTHRNHNKRTTSHPYLTRSSTLHSTQSFNITGTDYSTFNIFINAIQPILMQAHVSSSQTWLKTWKRTIMKTSSWNIIHCTLHIKTLHDLYNLLTTCPNIQQILHLKMSKDMKFCIPIGNNHLYYQFRINSNQHQPLLLLPLFQHPLLPNLTLLLSSMSLPQLIQYFNLITLRATPTTILLILQTKIKMKIIIIK